MKRTTFMAGPIYPIWSMDVLPGDYIKVNAKAIIESLPMRAPMLGGGKATIAFYWCPWSNYYRFMDNNERSSTEQVIKRKRHYYSLGANTGASGNLTTEQFRQIVSQDGVKAGTLLDFLGVPPGFTGIFRQLSSTTLERTPLKFSAEKFLSYLDIIRNYYVNNQENQALWLQSIYGSDRYASVPLSDLDRIFVELRNATDGIDISQLPLIPTLISSCSGVDAGAGSGLFLRTYKMDLLRGIMNASVGEYKSVVQVVDGQFTMEQVRFANKLQAQIDRIDITGGRFSDYMRTRWSVAPKNDMDRPIFLGSVASYIGNRDVVATASSSVGTNSSQPDTADNTGKSSVLGQQAGFTVGSVDQKHDVVLNADNYGTLMAVFSYVPYVDYSQGIELNDFKTTFAEIYSPEMAQLGFQDVSRLELSALPSLSGYTDTGVTDVAFDDMKRSVGKRIAWSEYMAGLNRNHGQFAYGESMDYWVYNRMYQTELDVSNGQFNTIRRYGPFDSTTYVKPELWNQLFTDVSPRAENYRLQVNFDVYAKRPIGKRVMPHL